MQLAEDVRVFVILILSGGRVEYVPLKFMYIKHHVVIMQVEFPKSSSLQLDTKHLHANTTHHQLRLVLFEGRIISLCRDITSTYKS